MRDHDFSRRHFAATFLGGAAGISLGTAAAADEPKTIERSSTSTVELLLELVRRIDPDRLKQEHLDQLRGDLELNLQRSKVLSAFALTNADEPAPVFAAWRSEG
jgi:hypothetical protein